MADPFVGEIRMFGFNFAPTGWAQCNGQLLPLSQNTALFSLLGTKYGGDGMSTFALPDLQGRVPLCMGQGPGLTEYFIGDAGGAESVTLLQSEIPIHTHTVMCSSGAADSTDPTGRIWASGGVGRPPFYGPYESPVVPMAGEALAVAGSSMPHNNLQPLLVVNFCIAIQGVFPPRP